MRQESKAIPTGHTSRIGIRARVVMEENGVTTLEFPSRELTDTERAVLRTLFPVFYDQATILLDRETIVSAIVED